MLLKPSEPIKPPQKTPLTVSSQINEPSKDDSKTAQKPPNSDQKPQKDAKRTVPRPLNPAKKIKLDSSPPPPSTTKYMVQWRKPTNKKHKSWDGDGVVLRSESGLIFKKDDGNGNLKIVGRTSNSAIEGVFKIGLFEVEIDYELKEDDESLLAEPLSSEPLSSEPPVENAVVSRPFKSAMNKTLAMERTPLYSTETGDSLILPPPKLAKPYVDVVVDPALALHLRPHQKEGVSFLYECLMGYRSFPGNGALLADDMGLGKTLMTITLLWTLLRQNPSPESKLPVVKKILVACPVTLIDNWKREFKKWLGTHQISVLALNNKQSAAKDKQDIISFGKIRVYQVLIMGYEKVLTCKEELKTVPVDLLVCDEGHRLKSSTNKVLKFLSSMNISKKIVLSGTPIQNDLSEFYNIINFINPGVLGSLQGFTKDFMNPISRSREVNCTNKDTLKRGEVMSQKLIELTKDFILRRTSSILSGFLTRKTDVVLFVPPTSLQLKLFRFINTSRLFNSIITENNSNTALPLITLFKKLCNSPSLLFQDNLFGTFLENESSKKLDFDVSTLLSNVSSSKINVLVPLLIEFRKAREKTVIVSNYTKTLDMLETCLLKLNIVFSRLDGSTSAKLRLGLVNEFNKPESPQQVFLLSSKSGGVGLNLVGASRLVMFDNDWNPSVDLQSMARIHRDGQTKPVVIYRLMTTGCIDEKIFQRQLMKNNLSDTFLDNKSNASLDVFNMTDLKDIFTVNEKTSSNTHDLLECTCNGIGEDLVLTDSESEKEEEEEEHPSSDWISALDLKQQDQTPIKKRSSIRSALSEYKHFDPSKHTGKQAFDCGDSVITSILKNSEKAPISYILSKVSETTL